jgi:hypothetical protein
LAGSLAGLLGATFCAGCTGFDFDANPFYVGHAHLTERGETSRTISAGPLWDDARSPDRRETAFHPFWRRVATSTETRTQVIDPLFATRTTNGESSFRFLALSWAKSHSSGNETGDFDFMFFPLFWYGSGPRPEENYFAFFPLFGTMKSFVGFAEASFFLFPLWYTVKKEITSPETFYSVTPLVGWVDGGPRDGSWHLLPLAGHWKYEGKYDKWSVLWPIVHWQRNELDTDAPTRDVTVWPLFGVETGKRMTYLTFLWPFFRFRRQHVTERDAAGLPHEEVYFRDDFLWPIYLREHDKGFDRLRFFPLYARYHSAELTSQVWAMPLFWLREAREKEWTKRTFDFVPFVHSETREWQDHRPDDSAFKLWPLFWTKTDAGADEVKIPALLPLDAERYTSDFEANWGPLVELFHDRREANGDRHGNALLRLVDWDSYGSERRFSLPLIWSARWDERRWRHDLLLGLVRFGGGAGGAEFRLLGMPIVTPEAAGR